MRRCLILLVCGFTLGCTGCDRLLRDAFQDGLSEVFSTTLSTVVTGLIPHPVASETAVVEEDDDKAILCAVR